MILKILCKTSLMKATQTVERKRVSIRFGSSNPWLPLPLTSKQSELSLHPNTPASGCSPHMTLQACSNIHEWTEGMEWSIRLLPVSKTLYWLVFHGGQSTVTVIGLLWTKSRDQKCNLCRVSIRTHYVFLNMTRIHFFLPCNLQAIWVVFQTDPRFPSKSV